MEHNKQSGFMNGMLLGLILGAGIALLLTTKKGKKILRAVTEEGFDSLTNVEDIYRRFERVTKQIEDDEEEESDFVPQKRVLLADQSVPVRKVVEPMREKISPPHTNERHEELEQEINEVSEALAKKYIAYAEDEQDDEAVEEEPVPKVKVTRRRFFRGIQRKN